MSPLVWMSVLAAFTSVSARYSVMSLWMTLKFISWVPAALYQRFWFDTIAGFALDVEESVPELRVGDALAAQNITGREADGSRPDYCYKHPVRIGIGSVRCKEIDADSKQRDDPELKERSCREERVALVCCSGECSNSSSVQRDTQQPLQSYHTVTSGENSLERVSSDIG